MNNIKYILMGDDFLNRTLIEQALRTTNEWDLVKLKSFYKAKDTINPTKQQSIEWERIFFTNSTSDTGLILKIYKNPRN